MSCLLYVKKKLKYDSTQFEVSLLLMRSLTMVGRA